MKTSELIGPALDWAVAKCDGHDVEVARGGWLVFDSRQDDPPAGVNEYDDSKWQRYAPSTDWAQGGPIIEREGISIESTTMRGEGGNFAWRATRAEGPAVSEEYGLTPLIAAMRCYLASKLGDEITLPEELNV